MFSQNQMRYSVKLRVLCGSRFGFVNVFQKGGFGQAVRAHAVFFLIHGLKGRVKGAPAIAVGLVGLALEAFAATTAIFGDGFVLKCHGSDCTLKPISSQGP